jgi:threonine dehydrogenase-like Zn-dependent dehydrogenase
MGLVDYVVRPSDTAVDEILALTGGKGVERAVDCSGSDGGRQTAVRAARDWGKIVFVGEGNTLSINPSPDMMHSQKTVYGSWVTSTWRMMDLVERLVRWGIHPGDLITHEFPIERSAEAYALMASGRYGKVAVVFPE